LERGLERLGLQEGELVFDLLDFRISSRSGDGVSWRYVTKMFAPLGGNAFIAGIYGCGTLVRPWFVAVCACDG